MPRQSVSQRAQRREDVAPDAQTGLFDREINDDVLAQALERRERAKVARGDAQAAFKEAHDVVKGKLDALDLEDDQVVRVGRFKITFRRTQGRSVSFDTSPSRRLYVSPLE